MPPSAAPPGYTVAHEAPQQAAGDILKTFAAAIAGLPHLGSVRLRSIAASTPRPHPGPHPHAHTSDEPSSPLSMLRKRRRGAKRASPATRRRADLGACRTAPAPEQASLDPVIDALAAAQALTHLRLHFENSGGMQPMHCSGIRGPPDGNFTALRELQLSFSCSTFAKAPTVWHVPVARLPVRSLHVELLGNLTGLPKCDAVLVSVESHTHLAELSMHFSNATDRSLLGVEQCLGALRQLETLHLDLLRCEPLSQHTVRAIAVGLACMPALKALRLSLVEDGKGGPRTQMHARRTEPAVAAGSEWAGVGAAADLEGDERSMQTVQTRPGRSFVNTGAIDISPRKSDVFNEVGSGPGNPAMISRTASSSTAFRRLKTIDLTLDLDDTSSSGSGGSQLFENFPLHPFRAVTNLKLSFVGVRRACRVQLLTQQLPHLTALQELHAMNLDCASVRSLEACLAPLTNLTCLTAEVRPLDAAVVGCAARCAGRMPRLARLELTSKLRRHDRDSEGAAVVDCAGGLRPGAAGEGWFRGLLEVPGWGRYVMRFTEAGSCAEADRDRVRQQLVARGAHVAEDCCDVRFK